MSSPRSRIELTNEPYIQEYNPNGMNFYDLAAFYVNGYKTVRASENILAGAKEVMVVIHDAFQVCPKTRLYSDRC